MSNAVGKAGVVSLFFAPGHVPAEPDDAIGASSERDYTRLGADAAGALQAAQRYLDACSTRDFLNRVLEDSTDAIAFFDLNGVITGWNGGAERMYGVSRTAAIMPWGDSRGVACRASGRTWSPA